MLCPPIKHKESKLCMIRSRKKYKCEGENVFSRSQYNVKFCVTKLHIKDEVTIKHMVALSKFGQTLHHLQ